MKLERNSNDKYSLIKLQEQSLFKSIQDHYFNEISKDGPVLNNKLKQIEFKISEVETNNL